MHRFHRSIQMRKGSFPLHWILSFFPFMISERLSLCRSLFCSPFYSFSNYSVCNEYTNAQFSESHTSLSDDIRKTMRPYPSNFHSYRHNNIDTMVNHVVHVNKPLPEINETYCHRMVGVSPTHECNYAGGRVTMNVSVALTRAMWDTKVLRATLVTKRC